MEWPVGAAGVEPSLIHSGLITYKHNRSPGPAHAVNRLAEGFKRGALIVAAPSLSRTTVPKTCCYRNPLLAFPRSSTPALGTAVHTNFQS